MPTFSQSVNNAWLELPGVPYLLVRKWGQQALARLWDARRWSWTLKRSSISILDSISLAAVGVTLGSPNVTSAALFTAGMLNRQFRVGTCPIYTVRTFTDPSNITLDRPYETTTDPTAAAEILDVYPVPPTDFGSFVVVIDLVNQVRIGHWYDQALLNQLDPARTNTDPSPRGIFSGTPRYDGRLAYEIWPYTTAACQLPYIYKQNPQVLADSADLPGVLGQHGDVLELMTKIEAAIWPGTREEPNPYFSLQRAETLKQMLTPLIRQLENRDDDQYSQNWDQQLYAGWPMANLAPTANYLRMTDAPAGVMDWGSTGGW